MTSSLDDAGLTRLLGVENPSGESLRKSLQEFVAFRQEHLTGDEKGEAQVFLDRLFRAFGHAGVFEAGATLEQRIKKHDRGGTAFADLVWRPRVLIEMKKGGEPLGKHYQQALDYWFELVPNRPAYVVLCNFDEFWIYDLNEQLDEPVDRVNLDQLPDNHAGLSFLLPEESRPVFRNDLVQLTRDTAAQVSGVFHRMKDRGVDAEQAQRFVLQSVMAMFAEDIGLLPSPLFKQAVEDSLDGGSSYDLVFGLFGEMDRKGITPGGRYRGTPYFNGGLYRSIDPVDLKPDELELLLKSSEADWSSVRPAIFGTLFEQSMGKDERHAYGAHFTSETDIQKVVRPTIVEPWQAQIDAADTIAELELISQGLQQYRVLDPTCGCGNFLYVAYQELRRLEKEVADRIVDRRRSGDKAAALRMAFVSTTQFYGIDLREFAVEVAKVTMMLARKIAADRHGDERTVLPLADLDKNIVFDDGLFCDWPSHEVTVGNPPYLGRQKLVAERGAGYVAKVDAAYPDVKGFADYVVYFIRKAHDELKPGQRAGLVATQTIRKGASRDASTEYIIENGGTITEAISSQPWSGDAQVHVSIINWIKAEEPGPHILWLQNGELKQEVDRISGALSGNTDLIAAKSLVVNQRPKRFFQGQTPQQAAFVVSAEAAVELVQADSRTAEILKPYLIGKEIGTQTKPLRFVIDNPETDQARARKYKAAFDLAEQEVLPARKAAFEEEERQNKERLAENPDAKPRKHDAGFLRHWWALGYRRTAMLGAIRRLDRYVALSRVAVESRPSVFVFVSSEVNPGDALQVFDFDDEYSLGILSSSVHQTWFRERATAMKKDPRYTSRLVFDSFPWPQDIEDDGAIQIATAMGAILRHRHELLGEGLSLNTMYAGFAEEGENRLRDLHAELDSAVIDGFGFSPADDMLAQLLALNESMAQEIGNGITTPKGPGNRGLPGTRVTDFAIRSDLPDLSTAS